MASLEVILNRNEVQQYIPYELICMTRYGARWETGKRRRRWMNEFTDEERNAAGRLFAKAHDWTLSRGVPDVVRMSTKTYGLWQKLGYFCATL